jgi:hypothetical protein
MLALRMWLVVEYAGDENQKVGGSVYVFSLLLGRYISRRRREWIGGKGWKVCSCEFE